MRFLPSCSVIKKTMPVLSIQCLCIPHNDNGTGNNLFILVVHLFKVQAQTIMLKLYIMLYFITTNALNKFYITDAVCSDDAEWAATNRRIYT